MSRNMKRTIGIVGGGAAGMTAAIAAASRGAEVILFEGNDRLGKKILATGNGKCNLGNMDLGIEKYNTENPELLQGYLERFGTNETIAFFRKLGLLIKQKNGYLYPVSEQASSVLDVLRFEIARLKEITVKTGCKIEKIEKDTKRNVFKIWNGNEAYSFDRVILTCGGKAAPKTGSDGSGYRMAKMLGHSVLPVVPALVQLKCREDWMKSVAGVRADAEIMLLKNGRVVTSERGELQITDYGISGIPTFQLSRKVGYILKEQNEVEICIDFLPDFVKDGFADKLSGARLPLMACKTVEEYFTGMLNKKLMLLFIKLAGLKPTEPAGCADIKKIKRVYELCRKLTVHIYADNSFDNAQVSAGGVPLCEITRQLESKMVPGAYFAGELLDVDGRCGGYNLQWAWCSGYLAGTYATDGEMEDATFKSGEN
ncbi:MAG: aminoacetone oxidase family FAD-binding enzyme [Lachnospiraceae bacterium]|nr:aminoacetone oxidase family FAD-binding enzyme [Lachnospiraceae bacterium]